ncbi:hypothetical protein Ddye_016116 [Dipteronia dyeriana]|uniref:Uncharacterized protein n=1 Tax=Dipteronia dyeriana TaxID=168575 RepID=A0AAD9U6N2_9ROSI|nr:hypothetical protein Ddye_016116 [Dipteronia dyeriana]
MDEIKINGGEEELGDDFYEKIEAPKFVDLKAPDHFRPQNDDRYWFCLRVGCDQKHGEETDSEEIYKNFVLRVMAARSPNVRFRKTLCRKDPSKNVKCPLTVPAKSSKSRISRLAMVSSISQKMVDDKVKARPLFPKNSPTQNEKTKQSSAPAKSLTTPPNKKHLSNPGTFRSVRNPNPTSIVVPKNRVVAKALVFHSPKKTVNINTSAELSTRMKAICAGMKKLEITGGKKQKSSHNKTLPLEGSRKLFRGREVKSRVYDSLRSKNCQGKEVKSPKRSKKKNVQWAPVEAIENDSSDLEIEEKSRNGLMEARSTSNSSKSNERKEHDEECLLSKKKLEFPLSEYKGEEAISGNTSRSNMTYLSNCGEDNNTINDGSDNEAKTDSNSEKVKVMDANKENPTSSDDKENESKAMSSDDKENNKKKLNLDTSQMGQKKNLGRLKTCKNIQPVSKGICKTSKGNSASSGVTCAEGGLNYKKPTLTNPKPFRLRTDERQILKEANLEKKLHLLEPLKEITTIAKVQGGSSQRKLNNRNDIENVSDAHDRSERKSDKTKHKDEPLMMRTSKEAVGRKQSTAQERHTISMHQKKNLAVASQQEIGQDRAAKRSEKTFKRTKSLYVKQSSTMSRWTESTKKKTNSFMTPGRLGVIEESLPTIASSKVVLKPLENGASPSSKISGSAAFSRSISEGRRRMTVLKEPHFHEVHRPRRVT